MYQRSRCYYGSTIRAPFPPLGNRCLATIPRSSIVVISAPWRPCLALPTSLLRRGGGGIGVQGSVRGYARQKYMPMPAQADKAKPIGYVVLRFGALLVAIVVVMVYVTSTQERRKKRIQAEKEAKSPLPAAPPVKGKPLNVTLYQQELHPLSRAIRAYLDARGIPYRTIEVSPIGRSAKLKSSVPYVTVQDDIILETPRNVYLYFESWLDAGGSVPDMAKTAKELEKEVDIIAEMEGNLTMLIMAARYGTTKAAKAALTPPESIPVGWFHRLVVPIVGPHLMDKHWQEVANGMLKANDATSIEQLLHQSVGRWLASIDTNQQFFGGADPNIVDLHLFGLLSAVLEEPIANEIRSDPRIHRYINDMQKRVAPSWLANTEARKRIKQT